jgi:hypothetical protein
VQFTAVAIAYCSLGLTYKGGIVQELSIGINNYGNGEGMEEEATAKNSIQSDTMLSRSQIPRSVNSSYVVESNQKRLRVRKNIFIFWTVQQSKTNDLTMLSVVDSVSHPTEAKENRQQ